ncbi:response regulator transcription factor [uncultured Paenibacillus sp.]|uniref:response regulator transcription factor n=1 Tax=uncultured Paenibacillus sp. TaxID=227322 RepID=UPI0015AC9EF3|nr:response regulator transcription factor [uncultured Paenibacillus sp.]
MHGSPILIVEDESEIAELLQDYLEEEQFDVLIAGDGDEALRMFKSYRPQLVILDIMLPKLNGLELCRMIRAESAVPIILLSAKKSDVDKILGLGLGADDYVVKPFSPGEVVARVKAQLRRVNQLSAPVEKPEDVLRFSELEIHLKAYEVKVRNRPVSCSAKEFEVLRFLALHPNQVLTREQIFGQVWGYNEYGDLNTVTVHMKKLREKIEENPSNPLYIKTVWGVGYKFDGGTP